MRTEARCSHPGCKRPATEIAVADSAWEDTATGSALMVCADHAETYVRARSQDAVQRAHRRSADR
jgi:hypothetical protein